MQHSKTLNQLKGKMGLNGESMKLRLKAHQN